MQKLRTVSAGIITLILIATGISPMFAQSDAARLQGIITDQSSALVPGAKVQVTDTIYEPGSRNHVRAG